MSSTSTCIYIVYNMIRSIFRNLIFTSSLSFRLHAVLRTMELKGHGVVVGTICCREVTSTNPFKLAMVGHGWPWHPWLERHHGSVFPCFFVGSLVFFPDKIPQKCLTVCWFFCCQVAVRVDLRSAQKLIHATESCKKCESFAEFSTKVSCCHSKINGCLQKNNMVKNQSHPLTFLLYY